MVIIINIYKKRRELFLWQNKNFQLILLRDNKLKFDKAIIKANNKIYKESIHTKSIWLQYNNLSFRYDSFTF